MIAAARSLKPARICVVYGHGGEQVPAAFRDMGLNFAKQQPQLGTGHALKQALPHLDARKNTLVLYGDVPLITTATLKSLCAGSGERLRLLTAELEDPHGYGRIVRNAQGAITAIVEEKDATEKQRRIREINTGIMLLPGKRLAGWLAQLSNRNAQREYYLTDVVALALRDRVRIESSAPGDAWEILGVNSMRQLAELERIHQSQSATRLLDAGVALADPLRIDVRGQLKCGRDVRIDVNCVFEGTVEIGDRCRNRRQLRDSQRQDSRGHAYRAIFDDRRRGDRARTAASGLMRASVPAPRLPPTSTSVISLKSKPRPSAPDPRPIISPT